MDKNKKKEYLDQLSSNELFRMSLEKASTEEERRRIKAFAEDVFLSIIEAGLAVKKAYEENPEKMVEVMTNHISKK